MTLRQFRVLPPNVPGRTASFPALNVPGTETGPAIFADPASEAVRDMLDRLAPTDVTVLIIGETGTGKEMAAHYVHAQSLRRGAPFLAVNCGALSETLAEAELFGHEKGAFTGAIRAHRGWFEAAQGGTLLLDEIGDLSLPIQVKLLRVLQEREVFRLGSRVPVTIDVRVIAATNVDLHAAITAKRFREDLYFRLNVATVMLPPLRERRASLPILAEHFLKLYGTRHGRPQLRLGTEALAALAHYSWPGNIRELENVIHNAVLLARREVIDTVDLQFLSSPTESTGQGEGFDAVFHRIIGQAVAAREPALFERVTRGLIQTVFDLAGGNQVRTAELLGISRNTLRTQLAHLGVLAPRGACRATISTAPAISARPAPLHELRIGYQKFGLLNILRAHRTLEERLARQGIATRWSDFPAGPQLLAALHAGQIDFGSTGEVPPVFAQADGAPIVYVAYEPAAPRGEAVVVPRDSPIRGVADLRGKRIAFNRGSNVQYLLMRGLEAHGLSLGDIEPVFVEPRDPRPILRGSEVDGWALWDPLLTIAQRSLEVRVLFDGAGLVANHQFHIASRALAEAHPQLIAILVEELRAIGQRVVTTPTEMARALSARIGIDVPTLEVAFKRLTHGTMPLDRDVIWEQQKIADRFFALGLIPRAVSVREVIWPLAK